MYSKPQFLHAQTYLNGKTAMLVYPYSMGKPILKTIIPFLKDPSKTIYPHNTSLKLYTYVDDIMIFSKGSIKQNDCICLTQPVCYHDWPRWGHSNKPSFHTRIFFMFIGEIHEWGNN